MNRFYSAFLFLIALSAYLHADCQPEKDFRKTKSGGIEIVDLNLSGATTVDSAELAEISRAIIGSCFDGKDQKFDEHIYDLFHAIGYVSVVIEDLRIETINPAIEPISVQVKGNVIEGQKCPSDVKALHQFLLDHRSNSLEADPKCVDGAFSALGFRATYRHDPYYIKALIELLDFERIDDEPRINHHFVRYPATELLVFPVAIPYLVSAIKEIDSELARTNAADTMFWIYRECTPAAVTKLNQEGDKLGTTPEQRTRLQLAAEYVENYFPGGPRPCKSNGQPATEKEAQKELDSQTE